MSASASPPSSAPRPSWERARLAACRAVAEGWRAVEHLYLGANEVTHKSEGPQTQADLLADEVIGRALRAEYPEGEAAYLTEETEDDTARLSSGLVWVIDPIDGTKDFIKRNGNFTLQAGLVERLEDGLWHPVAAAVLRPFPGEMYSASRGGGAWVEPLASGPAKPEQIRVSKRAKINEMKSVISSSHRDAQLDRLCKFMGFGSILSIGSIGIKVALVARGEGDVYVNLARGKCREWDICAPDLILREAGGIVTDLEGNLPAYNQREVHLPAGLLASNGLSHEELRAKVAKFEAQDAS